MTNLRKCVVGIRDSKLSKAQRQLLIKEAEQYDTIKKNMNFKFKPSKHQVIFIALNALIPWVEKVFLLKKSRAKFRKEQLI